MQFLNRPFNAFSGGLSFGDTLASVISIVQGGVAPLLSALTDADTAADGLTAAMTSTANYESGAGTIQTVTAEASINGGAFSAANMSVALSGNDTVTVRVVVADDQANSRTFSAGTQTVTVSATAPVASFANWDEDTDEFEVISDRPNEGVIVWAVMLTADDFIEDGAGGFTGSPSDTGSFPMGASGMLFNLANEDGNSGSGLRKFRFYHRVNGVDSAMVERNYTADNINPGIGSTTLTAASSTVMDGTAQIFASDAKTLYVGLRLSSDPPPTDPNDIINATGDIIQTAVVNDPPNGVSPVQWTGLTPDTEYQATPFVVDTHGNPSAIGTSSAAVSTASNNTAPAVPTAPAIAVVVPEDHRTIEVTLSADPANGGQPITRRDIRYSVDQTNWTEVLDVTSPARIGGLNPATQYFVEWRAVNSVGEGGWSAPGDDTTVALPPLFLDNTLEPFLGQIEDTVGGDGIIDTTPVAALTNLEVLGTLERFTDGRTRFITSSDGPATSAGGRARVEFRGEAERGGNTGFRFRWEAKLVDFFDSVGIVDGGRTVAGQIYDVTNGEDVFQFELRRNATDADLRIRYAPNQGDPTVSFTLKSLPLDGNDVSALAVIEVQFLPDRLAVWLDNRDPLTTAPDWDSVTNGGFSRDGTLDVYIKAGNYVQVDPAVTPVQTAVVDHFNTGSDEAEVLSTPATMAAPTVTAPSATAISVDLAVDPANGGLPIIRRDLRWSTDQTNWTEVIGVSDPQSVTGLNPGTQYFVQTRTVNGLGPAGAWSASGSATTQAASGNVIAISAWNEPTDVGDLDTDQPGVDNVHWATSEQTETLSADGVGGFLGGTALETGTVPTPGADQPFTIPTTATTGSGPKRLHIYQRIGGVDSNLVTQDYIADNAPPSVALRSPLDNATGVAVASVFVIDFDETMDRTGTYQLRLVGGAAVETFDLDAGTGDGGGTAVWSTNSVTDDRLTLALGANLTASTDYAWHRSGLQDSHRNPLPDVSDDTTYNFQTAAGAAGAVFIGAADFENRFVTNDIQTLAGINGVGKVVVAVTPQNGTDPRTTAVTIGGVAATQIDAAFATTAGHGTETTFWEAENPTSDTVDVTTVGSMDDWSMAAWDVTGLTHQPGVGANIAANTTNTTETGTTTAQAGDSILVGGGIATVGVLSSVSGVVQNAFKGTHGDGGGYAYGTENNASANQAFTLNKTATAAQCHMAGVIYR